ncbi:hypothetical protein FNF27_06272 [Cafeteria roenbergensis]|uniref:Queuine tRNA-ribosyltransferase catalytic subunit 1 n=1 Tax=Cafeteria roenbergensis TaxID=33653 RepID=A0A5A8E1E2_CAFRO|nr:hypothetical protein FNF27_06272 [Cafeteria roenbergensis]
MAAASRATIAALDAARLSPSVTPAAAATIPRPTVPFPAISPRGAPADGWGGPEAVACGPALSLRPDGCSLRARATTLRLPHGEVNTPIFMPVGTHGTVKGIPSEELAEELDCRIALANTYHLGVKPGKAVLDAHGGLHGLMRWPRNLLTDSGGFQMVSLLHLANITEEGVTFQSPSDGTTMLLTPEASIALQNAIGSDVMMALDDVVDSKTVDNERFLEACHRTLRWIDRCIAANANPDRQSLFAIVQGGLDVSSGGLREACLHGLLERDAALPGFAIGGLAGGEDKGSFWRVVAQCCEALPAHKPRYLMGVGYPLDLVVCSALGVDMFDCVFPTRTARFGVALVTGGQLRVKGARFRDDPRPLDPACGCAVCRRYSRAQLHALARSSDSLGPQLLSHHNIAYMLGLCRRMRSAIVAGPGPFQAFVRGFLNEYFPPEGPQGPVAVPRWAAEALAYAGVDIGPDLAARVEPEGTPDPDTAALPVVAPDWTAAAAAKPAAAAAKPAAAAAAVAAAAGSANGGAVGAAGAAGRPSKRERGD